jgi:hypothetical protein
MGWRVLTFEVENNWLSFQIEPMAFSPCKIYVPGQDTWIREAPDWARANRGFILESLKNVPFNRDVIWEERESAHFWPRHVANPPSGSLESTPGGKQLESLRLFQPESRSKATKEFAKKVWCKLAEKFATQASGKVTISESSPIEGSVFREIELPTLQKNQNVTLNWTA